MELLSERYGWTPNEIRDMNLADVQQYLEIILEIKLMEKGNALKNKK
jgi:hypothetical protein